MHFERHVLMVSLSLLTVSRCLKYDYSRFIIIPILYVILFVTLFVCYLLSIVVSIVVLRRIAMRCSSVPCTRVSCEQKKRGDMTKNIRERVARDIERHCRAEDRADRARCEWFVFFFFKQKTAYEI